MAPLEKSNWLVTWLRGPKPMVRANYGIKAFSEAAYKASNGAPPRLVSVYRSYKEQAMIASDPDAPEATDEQLAQAKPFAEAFPALAETMRKGWKPRAERPKLAVSIRLDQEVIDRFRAAGPGWQSRINEALRHVVGL